MHPQCDRALDGRVHRRLHDRAAVDARHAPARSGTPWPTRRASAPRSVASTGRSSAGSTSSRPTRRRSAACRSPTRRAGTASTAPAWLSAVQRGGRRRVPRGTPPLAADRRRLRRIAPALRTECRCNGGRHRRRRRPRPAGRCRDHPGHRRTVPPRGFPIMSQTLPPPPESPPDPPAGWSEPRPAAFPAPVAAESGYLKFRNEVLAGGASERPEGDDLAGGPRAVIGIVSIVVLLALIGIASPWALVFVLGLLVCIFLHEVRPLRDRPLDRHEGHPVLPVHGPEAVELPARRDRVRHPCPPARRVRADHRHEQPRRGRPGRRAPRLPQQELPAAHARHLCRLDHAHDHRDRPAVRPSTPPRACSRAPTGSQIANVRAGDPAAEAGLQADDVILSSTASRPPDSDELRRARAVAPARRHRAGRRRARRRGAHLRRRPRRQPQRRRRLRQAYMGTGSGSEYVWTDLSLGTAIDPAASPISATPRGRPSAAS